MSVPLDSSLCKELAGHIETITNSGLKSLDSDVMKKVKKICRLSDVYVEETYHLVVFQLGRPHAEIRLSAFQIIDELFRRSHCFRELLISNLQRIMELTVEISPDHPLPPPRTAALNLKRLALRSFRDWTNVFGDGYKKLKLGFNFLKHCKKVDFNALEMEDSAERMRQQELERRQRAINEERLKKVDTEMKELSTEINGTLIAMKNCFELLLPAPENFFISDEDAPNNKKSSVEEAAKPCTSKTGRVSPNDGQESSSENSPEEVESNFNPEIHGWLNPNFKMELEVNHDSTSIKKTTENAAVFENANDLYTLIVNRYLPCVKKWESVITKSSGSTELLKNVINLKCSLEDAVKKYSHLNIKPVASDSSDSEFEEVEVKEGYEEDVHEDLPVIEPSDVKGRQLKAKTNDSGWSIWSKENNEKDPTSAQSTLVTLASVKPTESKSQDESSSKIPQNETPPSEPQPSTSSGNDRKSKLLAVAPKLPFDVDLYHWEDENITAPTMLSVKPEGARFWSATSNDDLEEIPVPDGAASLRTRVIEFSGKFEPVKWACRAPLKSGKLCPRRDRYKCPFHGRIVPRDEAGNCTNPEDAKTLEQCEETKKEECPDWQDPQLLAEIKASTGIDLKMPERGKDGKLKRKKKEKEKEKYPGLTDISAYENTSITRLSKKVFKRATMKKVARAMDRADQKRFRDKFGDQFNYVYNT